ncbi:PDZ domain-containing protein [Viridibacillus sp. YIM B01967]|uniref:PDZ domain-containing protein n=1 Tax=Viridibacillus soli TaxID=2798301 RepID=A0ABS1H630_9BACL|nr:PDZ domain-containing protein [Viridibacillus soli]MBK3494869.1 PDZ domain-containing protein [Viridibacillus soli]
MYLDILIELLKGIGRFVLNPILYVAIIFTILLGYRRVITERKSFNTRIRWGWTETLFLLKDGWLLALGISIISIGLGLVVPLEYLVLFICASIICILTFYYTASAVYPLAIAFGVIWYLQAQDASFNFLWWTFTGNSMDLGLFVVIPAFVGLLLLAEGILIYRHAVKFASPRLEKSDRGMPAATYLVKRLWLLPIFFVIPGGLIQAYIPYWPQLTMWNSTFSFILVPVVIGFQQRSRKTLPVHFYPRIGKAIILLAMIVLLGAIVAPHIPAFGFVGICVAVGGRILISIIYAWTERDSGYAVTPQNAGVVIAAILPGSPAQAMGLQVGECIRKVNGIEVQTEEEMYEALQVNAAQCRIEVLNHDGEVRLRQQVIHRHDHYKIGLLVVR